MSSGLLWMSGTGALIVLAGVLFVSAPRGEAFSLVAPSPTPSQLWIDPSVSSSSSARWRYPKVNLFTTLLCSAAHESDTALSRDAWETDSDDDDDPEFDSSEEKDKDPDNDNGTDDPRLSDYMQWKDALEACRKALDKKQKSLQTELEKAERVEETIQRAELITSNMYLFTPGVRSATVNDWNNDGAPVELVLNKAYDSASAEADALFQQARKVKRGSQIVRPLLDEIDNAQQILTDIQMDFDAVLQFDGSVNENILRLLQERLGKSAKTTGFRVPSIGTDASQPRAKKGSTLQNNQRKRKPPVGTPASNLRKFQSPGGCVVLVGRNRQGNEYLTFNLARGEDVWMQ